MKTHTGIIITALACLATCAHATPQAGESMVYRGTNHYVHAFYLRKDMQRTFDNWREKGKGVIISSANWGGWYADLEVRDDTLYLTGLDIDRPDRIWPFNGPSIKKVFGLNVPKKGIFAEWFTGELEEGIGNEILSYTGITKESLFFVFEKGILKKVEIRESSGSRMMKEFEDMSQKSTNNVLENIGTNAPNSQH